MTYRQYGGTFAPTIRRASSRAFTTSSGSGPFSLSSKFCSSCAALLAPRMMPSSGVSAEWCWHQRSAISVRRSPCFSWSNKVTRFSVQRVNLASAALTPH